MTAPTPDDVERRIVVDIARRGFMAAPLLVLVEALVWGVDGALCALYAVGLVLVNFALSGALLGRAARMSLNGAMAVILGGFLVRMGLVAGAVLAVRNAGWVHPAALGVTIFVTHLGLVVWEARYLSLTLAFPGLKPTRGDS